MGTGFVNGGSGELELKTYAKQDCTFACYQNGTGQDWSGNSFTLYANKIIFPKGVAFKNISSIEICQKSGSQYYYIVKLSNTRIGMKSPSAGGVNSIGDRGNFQCLVFGISEDATYLYSPYSFADTMRPAEQSGISSFSAADIEYINITILE